MGRRARSTKVDAAPIQEVVDAFESLFDRMPGYLGLTSRGYIAIHADWPIYPVEHGLRAALASFGNFPVGTLFKIVDEIDGCFLLRAEGYGSNEDDYDERALHVAVWHEDLIEVTDLGFIQPVERITEREWVRRYQSKMRERLRTVDGPPPADGATEPLDEITYLGENGEWVRASLPSLDDYDDEALDWAAMRALSRIYVTDGGWRRLEALLADSLEIPKLAQHRLEPLLAHELYDSALRELGAMLESQMRLSTSSSDYGLPLVDAFIDHLDRSRRFIPASIKILRGELRTAFKFVRNEFAHNIVDLPKPRGLALISRLSKLVAALETIGTAPIK